MSEPFGIAGLFFSICIEFKEEVKKLDNTKTFSHIWEHFIPYWVVISFSNAKLEGCTKRPAVTWFTVVNNSTTTHTWMEFLMSCFSFPPLMYLPLRQYFMFFIIKMNNVALVYLWLCVYEDWKCSFFFSFSRLVIKPPAHFDIKTTNNFRCPSGGSWA